jgi:hypothetical protein
MTQLLWIVGIVFGSLVILAITGLLIDGRDRKAAARKEESSRRLVRDERIAQESAADRSIREHARLVEQYKAMIDELYDYGNKITRDEKSDRDG